jgi:acetyl-CoA carboxylase biotin carboxylase subunit
LTKILIANRGEIALRITRTCHAMGISSVVVYSDADRDALFVNMAEEAVCIGGNTPLESYLDQDKIIAAAHRTGADAIHPGYGFLSENAAFAQRCADEGLVFIGPSPKAIQVLGSKSAAKNLMAQHNVPIIKGYNGADQTAERLLYEAAEIGFPLLVKASAGGGGKGMRIVRESSELATAIEGAKREALAAFGDETLLLERFFDRAKHIEVQIVGDTHGKILHFFERECSVQRRFQKIIEEAPSPSISDRTRRALCAAAIRAGKAVNYHSAGTVEFILDENNDFYFLEVNTRLQVEHPVTEEITGVDIVRLQIEIATGAPLPIEQDDIEIMGSAIEARIYAEQPRHDFRPSSGSIALWSEARVPEIRYETGVETGSVVSTFYDPMLAKVIAAGPNRIEAAARLSKALGELCVLGVGTNRGFLMELLRNPDFLHAKMDTKYVDRNLTELAILGSTDEETLHEYAMAIVLWRTLQRTATQNAALQHLPKGWRNNFFAPQSEKIMVGTDEYLVKYRFLQNEAFRVSVNNLQFENVSIKESGDNHVTLVIDGHKNTYDIAYHEGDNTNYYVQRVDFPDEHLIIVPPFPEIVQEVAVGAYLAAMPGEIVKINVKVGDMVENGAPLFVLSSMKMENTVYANANGVVQEIFIIEKQFVEVGALMLRIIAP